MERADVRIVFEFLARVFGQGKGRHRAVIVPTPPARRPAPTWGTRLAPVVYVDDQPLVRPYLVAFEREQERYLQRERRRAAALAAMGQDHDFAGAAA